MFLVYYIFATFAGIVTHSSKNNIALGKFHTHKKTTADELQAGDVTAEDDVDSVMSEGKTNVDQSAVLDGNIDPMLLEEDAAMQAASAVNEDEGMDQPDDTSNGNNVDVDGEVAEHSEVRADGAEAAIPTTNTIMG